MEWQGNLSLITRPDQFGPIPEPMLSVFTRQMLHALGVLHSHGVSCSGKLKASSFWLLPDGRLKLGALFHFDIPSKKNMDVAISQDLHALLEAVEQLADARSQDAGMLARHEFENKIKVYELKVNQLRTEKASIVKREGDSGKDKKQQMHDETRLAILTTELKSASEKLENVRAQIHKADEAMRLFPLTYSSKGRCHDFVAQAARPILKLGQVYHHAFVSSYLDVGAEALVRWVALKGYRGNGNRLASTLYEVDPDVQAEIEQASQKPDARRKQVPAPYGLPFTCATNGHLDLWCCMPARAGSTVSAGSGCVTQWIQRPYIHHHTYTSSCVCAELRHVAGIVGGRAAEGGNEQDLSELRCTWHGDG